MRARAVSVGIGILLSVGAGIGAFSADAGASLEPLVFDTPAENDRGLMILGNGEVGAIAWIDPDGTLHTRLQRSDSWNEAGCHVKVGAIDYVTGRTVDEGSFRQELLPSTGEFLARWTSGGGAVSLSYRIQRGAEPFAVCRVEGAPTTVAKVVNWRLYPGGAKAIKIQTEGDEPFAIDNWFFRSGAAQVPGKCFTVNADRLLPDGWVHENRRETVREMMSYYARWQATDDLGKPDLLTDRVFGAITRTDRAGDAALFVTAVTCFHPCASAVEWERRTRELLEAKGWDLTDEAAARTRHQTAWTAIWNRSFIRLAPSQKTASRVPSLARECALVQRAWELQRYATVCAGGGSLPIRFNGSIFTAELKGDPDCRRWGSGYWWQNTRLAYYPMLAAGDFDLMQGLFNMYLPLLDFNRRRTRKYLGHGGAYFPECMQPWGDHFADVYGCRPWAERTDKLQDNEWHKYEWVGQLELSLLLLERWAFTGDDDWFRREALPSIREYVRFFDEHYKLRPDGCYDWQPAQAAETWWKCTTPMPETAGLRRVTDLLLALPDGLLTAADRALFAKISARIPKLPERRLKNGTRIYAAADSFAIRKNCENPELYCVFPFRLCSFEKPNAEQGRRTYGSRREKRYSGWTQDELFAAYLGLTDEARQHLVNRVATNSAKEFRWPAYWGPNFDWMPDQCAGGNIQNITQSMLIQWDGKKIFLLPAWPKDWNCHFRLHAPFRTTVEGWVVDGRLQDLTVTPAERRQDVVFTLEQE